MQTYQQAIYDYKITSSHIKSLKSDLAKAKADLDRIRSTVLEIPEEILKNGIRIESDEVVSLDPGGNIVVSNHNEPPYYWDIDSIIKGIKNKENQTLVDNNKTIEK